MKLYRFVIILVILLAGDRASAQEPIPGNYKDNFLQGNYLMLEENYPMALQYFKEAYYKDSSSANINYKVGLCYLKSMADKRRALPYLKRAANDITKNYDEFEPRMKRAPQSALYYLGQAYHLNYKFDSALVYLEAYKAIVGSRNPELSLEIEEHINWAKNAQIAVQNPISVKIQNMGDSINSQYPEYGPVISLDENTIYFTSRRLTSIDDSGKLTINEKGIDGIPFEDVYVSYRKRDSSWTTPVCLSPVIDHPDNSEATISLTTDAQTLFIYKADNGGDVFETHLEGDKWTPPVTLGGDICSSAWEPHACLSADGNTLYFVSDRKGGYGGRDIYRCLKLPNGRWAKATNLGPTINTPYDEDAPFIHPDKVTMFFSSQGHNSMGGFDIFFTSLNDSGQWAEPVSMGYPINTPDDDIYYTTSADGKRAYFSSVRDDSHGDKDLYMATLRGDSSSHPLTLLKGYIYNADGSPLTQDIRIMVYNDDTNEPYGEYRPNKTTGTFAIILQPGYKYRIEYNVDGVVKGSEVLDVPMGSEFASIERALNLDNFVLGSSSTDTSHADTSHALVSTENRMALYGKLMDKKAPKTALGNGITVTLTDDKGDVTKTTTTIRGGFSFEHLLIDRSYTVDIDEFDNVAAPMSTIKLIDETTNKDMVSTKATTPNKFTVKKSGKTITFRFKKPGSTPVVTSTHKLQYMNVTAVVMDKVNVGQRLTTPVKVVLKDGTGKQVGDTVLTQNGSFTFEHLNPYMNYLVLVNEFDNVAAHFDSITVVDQETGEALANLMVPAKDDKFTIKKTGKVISLRLLTAVNQPIVQGANVGLSKDTDKVYYELSFKYNVSGVDPSASDFLRFIDDAAAVIAKKGSITFRLTSSASQVPTRSYPDNKALSLDRATKAKQAVIDALKSKGIDSSKIKWLKVNAYVLGPTYHADYIENRRIYEKFQYIKIKGE